MTKVTKLFFYAICIFWLQGCLLLSPFDAQKIATIDTPVTFTLATGSLNPIKLECMKTARWGPELSPRGPWQEVTHINVPNTSTSASVFTVSEDVYKARPDEYITSVRVSQQGYIDYYTLDEDGLGCVTASLPNGLTAWIEEECHRQYTNGTPIYEWVRLVVRI